MSDSFTEKPTDFLAQKPYPAEPPSPATVLRPRKSSPWRYILPGVLFVVVVGVIAWVTQFMPNWRKKDGPSGPQSGNAPVALIKFPFLRAVWDRDDPDYALEQERGSGGRFDFPFENSSSTQAAELGLYKRSCDCSHLEVCLTSPAEWERYQGEIVSDPLKAKPGDWTWHKINEGDTTGFEVPAGGKGFIRVVWDGRKEIGSRLRLTVDVWHQPKGKPRERPLPDKLEVPILMAAPVMFAPPRLSLGNLGPNDSAVGEFDIWTSTRDEFDLKFADTSNPLIVQEITPVSKEECRQLENRMRKEGDVNSRIRKAHRVKVTVREKAGEKQLDQGPFYHAINFVLDGETISGPLVVASIKGDIIVGNLEDRGRADLKTFRAKDGAARDLSLWTDSQLVLEHESHTPATLEVKLEKKETTGNRAKWLLKVTVPPNTHFGPFTEESVIILRTLTTPPRFLRIPVAGHAQS